jgi:hypothetical protein
MLGEIFYFKKEKKRKESWKEGKWQEILCLCASLEKILNAYQILPDFSILSCVYSHW